MLACMFFDHPSLIDWFEKHKRPLPWRDNPTPYQVWISEVMLQQTQVAVVLPYFLRWMERFPSIHALALASQEEVIKCWEGLGYYSRARFIHHNAKFLSERFGGEFPNDSTIFQHLKGIGPYTQGAIESFAFHLRSAAVDGNVMRVLTRYFALPVDIGTTKGVKTIWKVAEEILPKDRSWVHNEALIELGATCCTKVPKCNECPLKSSCRSFQEKTASQFPVKNKRTTTTLLDRTVLVIQSPQGYLMRQVKEGVMRDLWEFFWLPDRLSLQSALEQLALFQLDASFQRSLPTHTHTFTRFRVTLFPSYFVTKNALSVAGWEWIPAEQLSSLALSSGHRKIVLLLNHSVDCCPLEA